MYIDSRFTLTFNVVFVDLDDFYDNAALFGLRAFVYQLFNVVLIVFGCSD